ncbi:MAG TPA: helix-turn-helix domain-containing protein [Gemmatimonadaceae bacterium]|nr:helix-turn-helix domain-containing protein [Gemmatimonadaceae bacterium]
MARGADGTKERLVEAAERLLVRDGHRAVGVNAVAAECGVDKVLIYRYFGGLPQLLERVRERQQLWPALGEETEGARSLDVALSRSLLAIARELRENPLVREAALWEGAESNPLTEGLAAQREREMDELLELVRSRFRVPTYLDVQALVALLAAGLMHLSTRPSESAKLFGLDPNSDADWQRLEKMTASITRVLTGPAD